MKKRILIAFAGRHVSTSDVGKEPRNTFTDNTNDTTSQDSSLLNYFLLVFALAVPFWLFGGRKLPLPFNLPVGALVTFVPMIAAAFLCYRQNGFAGVKRLFKRSWDYGKTKHKIWYLPALVLAPLIYVASYVVMYLLGLPLPDTITIPLFMVPLFFVMFLIGDTGEELGWSGYAIDPMQKRWGTIKASIILGIVWGMWHSIPFVQTGNAVSWIVWQCLGTIPLRILIVWIYNKTGKSVFAATLFHAAGNVSWSLFPNYGSHYDPFITCIITWVAAGIVTFRWGAGRSAHHKQVT